jgi:hypothetical protein
VVSTAGTPEQGQPVTLAVAAAEPTTTDGRVGLFLSHADRCWKAEEVNATRIAARGNLVLTGVVAVLGLKLYSASTEMRAVIRAEPGSLATAFWGLAAFGLAGMLWALKIVLEVKLKVWEAWSKKPRSRTACRTMHLTVEQVTAPSSSPEHEVAVDLFKRTYAAVLELNGRNDTRNRMIERAQIIFFLSSLCLFGSLGAYAAIDYLESRPEARTMRESAP